MMACHGRLMSISQASQADKSDEALNGSLSIINSMYSIPIQYDAIRLLFHRSTLLCVISSMACWKPWTIESSVSFLAIFQPAMERMTSGGSQMEKENPIAKRMVKKP